MINALTIDIEDWYHILDVEDKKINFENWNKCEDRVEKNTLRLLEILNERNVKATFFILGWIAERHPALVVNIKKAGHEIATHGYAHRLIYKQSHQEFADDLEKSLAIIESITKEKIIGYRGAGFSITAESVWALRIVAERGLKYDSTIFPAKRGHGGLDSAKPYPHLMYFGGNLRLWEFPISVTSVFGKSIPFSGGGYLRLFPYWFIRHAIKSINKKGFPAIIYIHPREIDVDQPRMNLPLDREFKYYVNLSTTEAKIRALLTDFNFAPVREVLGV